MVARTIHQLSQRASQPMVTVNCAAIPEELIESELFGHEKGAISGVAGKMRGKFELANDGTIFLDEIGDMSLKTQSKILRVLQEQKFNRVGGSRIITVNVRVIAATNKDLRVEMEKGRFRQDLFFRLNVVPIEVPSLRERIADLPLLVETFLAEFSKQSQKPQIEVSESAMALLSHYPWPGNVRELKNLVERLAIMVEKDVIDAEDLPAPYNPNQPAESPSTESPLLSLNNLKEAKRVFEQEFIRRKLAENQNNVTKTAESIGVGRSYLHKKIKQLRE